MRWATVLCLAKVYNHQTVPYFNLGGSFMISKKYMMDCVYDQLAIDYNCAPDDFLKDGLIFTEARENKERRPFPWVTPRLEMITMGHSVVINATGDILPLVR